MRTFTSGHRSASTCRNQAADRRRGAGMKVLITGSRGAIGTVMAPMMVAAGHQVVGVDADLYRRSTFGTWTEAIRTIPKDVRALEARDLEGFEAIVHLAALSNDPLGDLNPQLTFDINH